MKDPEIELRRGLHNVQTSQNLTYEEFCLYGIKNLIKGDVDAAKRNVKKIVKIS